MVIYYVYLSKKIFTSSFILATIAIIGIFHTLSTNARVQLPGHSVDPIGFVRCKPDAIACAGRTENLVCKKYTSLGWYVDTVP